MLDEHVHSDKIASRHLPCRGMLVFGMSIFHNPNVRVVRQFWLYFLPILARLYGSSSRRKKVAKSQHVIDRISSIPEFVRLLCHHEYNRTTDQRWQCRWHFGFCGRAGRTDSMSCLGSDIRSTRSSNCKLLFSLSIERSTKHGSMGKCEDVLGLCLGTFSSRICTIGFFKYRAELQRCPAVVSQHGKISNLVFKTQMALPPTPHQSQNGIDEYCNSGS